MNERGFAAVDKLEEVGRGHDATIAQMAIAWVLANPAVTSAIIGANTIAQLEDTTKGAAVKLSAAEKAMLDEVTAGLASTQAMAVWAMVASWPSPCLLYTSRCV